MKNLLPLAIPTNFDDSLLDSIDWSRIESVYGKMRHDFVGGGRGSITLPNIDRKKAKRHIRKIRDKGVSFDYLLNAACLDNQEFTTSGQKKITELIKWLVDIGVDSVTVTIPYLLELVKERFPELKVSVSTQAGVDSPQRAKYWAELGADKITLSVTDVNRDFKLLRKIRAAVPQIKLQLLANLECLRGCPFYKYHANINAHASQTGHRSGGFYIDYCYLSCTLLRLEEPARFFMAGWIRPEDQHYYAQIGIDSLKLVNRTMATPQLVRIIQAYSSGRYDGNLLDLFSHPAKNISYTSRRIADLILYLLKPWKVNLIELFKVRQAFDLPYPYIDNRKLDGFIDYFVSGKCEFDSCGTSCTYCYQVARRVFQIDESERRKAIDRLKKLKKALNDGSLFRYL